MTDEELKQLVASLAIAQQETSLQIKETDKQIKEMAKETSLQIKETDRQFKEMAKETDRQFKETRKQLKELGTQIGGLGKKFGSFTEGLALPSMTKILRERFKMEVINPSVRVRKKTVWKQRLMC
jgi:hypothetical protein